MCSRSVVCVFLLLLWLALVSKVASWRVLEPRLSNLSSKWSMLFLTISNKRSINDAVLNGNIGIVYIKLWSIFVSYNGRNERIVWFSILLLLVENMIIRIKISRHSWFTTTTLLRLCLIMWIKSFTAIILLLHISCVLIGILINRSMSNHVIQVWFIFRTCKIMTLHNVSLLIHEAFTLLLFLFLC